MGYKDRTFCISPNCVNNCGRKLTENIRKDAKAWWGGDDAPISVGYFCGPKEECLVDKFVKNNPSSMHDPLLISCPCRKCNTQCQSN